MRRAVRGVVRLKHLNRVRKPDGRILVYFRPKGKKGQRLPDLPEDHPDFLAAYVAAAGIDKPPRPKSRTGSISAGIEAFLASDAYLSRSLATRSVWRRTLDKLSDEYGRGEITDLESRHIRSDLAPLTPHPANNRLKVWRAVCRWWLEVGLINDNPARTVFKRATPKTEGHASWTADDIIAFRRHWPIGTSERLAFEILHWTGARISDAVRMGEPMIDKEGWLTYHQSKTGGEVSIPLTAPPPEFSDPAGQKELLKALDARTSRHVVFMVTAYGKARSIKAASSWFSKATFAAGIRGKSAHGLRKTRATTMAEGGATTHQIGAWTGHESLSEVQHYSRKADRKKLLSGTKQQQKVPTLSIQFQRHEN